MSGENTEKTLALKSIAAVSGDVSSGRKIASSASSVTTPPLKLVKLTDSFDSYPREKLELDKTGSLLKLVKLQFSRLHQFSTLTGVAELSFFMASKNKGSRDPKVLVTSILSN